MALSVNQNSGAQNPANQSNLQSSSGNDVPALSGQVQPGTPTGELTSHSGVALTPRPVTTVNLAGTTATVADATPSKPVHHFNPLLIGLAAVCLVLAIGWFAAIARSGKKHNQYL